MRMPEHMPLRHAPEQHSSPPAQATPRALQAVQVPPVHFVPEQQMLPSAAHETPAGRQPHLPA